ncbi:MAG: hypothetical protein F6K40_33110 [Okeania sp. SIO3I5]|uniref:hypothetical protein n=1 Tax=Okeania sp. SIO3I5 TaxID=2607805 RepID=UPI0013BD269D|nr:hypothetical protein [Okeania sp. SIO3I5]NEQ40801.1 hypothetical protein [Okeania sp. SIO3I5]
MSNEIARCTGLERGVEAVDTSSDVIFPTSQYMNQLKKSVSFTKSELTNLLTENGIIFEAI